MVTVLCRVWKRCRNGALPCCHSCPTLMRTTARFTAAMWRAEILSGV
jgi:hypothetical protein